MNEYDDVSDLDEVIGPLRSAATSAELSQQAAMVDRMVNTRRTAGGQHMFTSRRARVATLVAAGVLGFGGMAAASPSILGERAEKEPDVEVEFVEDETLEPIEIVEPESESIGEVEVEVEAEPEPIDAVDVTVEPVAVEPAAVEPAAEVEEVEPPAGSAQVEPTELAPTGAPLVDDPDTAFDETTCLPGNHGTTVSAVARGEFPGEVSVVDAARSSCGKTGGADVDDPEIEPEPDTAIGTESEASPDRPERDKGPASNEKANEKVNERANEKASGKANGEGKGERNGEGKGNSEGRANGKGAPGTPGG